jgi:hemoglobin/transferrin/lactoferrin receptor protein
MARASPGITSGRAPLLRPEDAVSTRDAERPSARAPRSPQDPTPPAPRPAPSNDASPRASDPEPRPRANEAASPQLDDPPPTARSNAIVVRATRTAGSDLDAPRATSTVTPTEIERRLPQTTPDALAGEVGVVVQKTNQGGGSPVIRGRTGKEILLLIDGQRFNDATFRRNTQYLNTIDLGAVERLEVVRGPTSVEYGSDAIGGLVNVVTRRTDPTGERDHVGGRAYAQFGSANTGTIAHLGVEGEIDGFGFTAGGTWKDFGDLRAGSRGDPVGAVDRDGVQDPTAYEEAAASFSLRKRLNDTTTLDLLYLYTQQEDVPRSDRLIANDNQPVAPDLERHFDPQILRWYQLGLEHDDPGATLESFRITATFNNPEENRRRVRTNDPATVILEKDTSEVFGLSADATLALGDHHVTAGIQANHQTVRSARATVDRTTGARTPSPNGRFPDDAVYESYGVFVEDRWDLAPAVSWTNGVRWSLFRTAFDLGGLTVGPPGDTLGPFGSVDQTYDDVTFATALSVAVADDTFVHASIARGFRAPNLDDLAVVGDFAAGDRIPSVDVDPETVHAFELGLKHGSERLAGELVGAVALYDDLLDNRFAFSQGGTDFFRIDNVGRAVVWSTEAVLSYVLVPAEGSGPVQTVYGQGFFNYGENVTDDEPVSKIPPAQGRIGWRIEAEDGQRWFAEAFVDGALEQDRLSTADRADPRFAPRGTPAWWTFNLRAGLRPTDSLRIGLALENVFDERYRVHGSGIDAPGFDAVVHGEWVF